MLDVVDSLITLATNGSGGVRVQAARELREWVKLASGGEDEDTTEGVAYQELLLNSAPLYAQRSRESWPR